MSDLKIRTNNVPRDVIDAADLADAEREQFDYLDWPAIDDGRDSASFFRFRGELYDLGNFIRVEPGGDLARAGWGGYAADSYFSGVVIKFVNNYEQIIVGTYYC